MVEARYYIETSNQNVQCLLCPWNCILKPGQTGECRVRTNRNGKLYTQVYNKVAALAIDPIEKKPLYHFAPGKKILSIGEVGCNLHCNFCQNHDISQCSATDFKRFKEISSPEIIELALKTANNIGIAYTYNEPFTFYEFLIDTAELAHQKGLKNVVVSNGYINPAPLQNLLPYINAFNIDLKAYSNTFYQKQTSGKLQPVLRTIKTIAKSRSHLEITTLIIPGLNDNQTEFEAMLQWIQNETGENTPLHLSKYFPRYKQQTAATNTEKLVEVFHLAKKYLKYVYLGNIYAPKYSSTVCPACGALLIQRNNYETQIVGLNEKHRCTQCNNQILLSY